MKLQVVTFRIPNPEMSLVAKLKSWCTQKSLSPEDRSQLNTVLAVLIKYDRLYYLLVAAIKSDLKFCQWLVTAASEASIEIPWHLYHLLAGYGNLESALWALDKSVEAKYHRVNPLRVIIDKASETCPIYGWLALRYNLIKLDQVPRHGDNIIHCFRVGQPELARQFLERGDASCVSLDFFVDLDAKDFEIVLLYLTTCINYSRTSCGQILFTTGRQFVLEALFKHGWCTPDKILKYTATGDCSPEYYQFLMHRASIPARYRDLLVQVGIYLEVYESTLDLIRRTSLFQTLDLDFVPGLVIELKIPVNLDLIYFIAELSVGSDLALQILDRIISQSHA